MFLGRQGWYGFAQTLLSFGHFPYEGNFIPYKFVEAFLYDGFMLCFFVSTYILKIYTRFVCLYH